MFCPKCGAQVTDGAAFCPACGNALSGDRRQAGPAPSAPAPRRRSKAPLVAALAVVVVVAGVVVAGMLTNWFGLAAPKAPAGPAGTYLLDFGGDQSISLTVGEDGQVSLTEETGLTESGRSTYEISGEGTVTVQGGSALIEVDDPTGDEAPDKMAFVVPTGAAERGEIEGDWAVLLLYDTNVEGILSGQLVWANVDGDGTITLRAYTNYTGEYYEEILGDIHAGTWHDDGEVPYNSSGTATKVGDATYDCGDGNGNYVLTASYERP